MKKLSDQSKHMIIIGVVIGVLIIVAALLLKYYEDVVVVFLALVGFLIYEGHEKKQVQQQQASARLQAYYGSASQVLFVSSAKLANILGFQSPLTPEDVQTQPCVVSLSGFPVFQFKLTKMQATNQPDTEICGRLEKLLQGGMNKALQSGDVPNIPYPAWKAADGKIWPLFTILAVREEPLYYIVQLVVVDNPSMASFLSARKYGRHNPPPTSPSDPDF